MDFNTFAPVIIPAADLQALFWLVSALEIGGETDTLLRASVARAVAWVPPEGCPTQVAWI